MSEKEKRYDALIRIQRRLSNYFSQNATLDTEESFKSILEKILQTAISELREGGHYKVKKGLLLFGTGEGGPRDIVALAKMEDSDINFSKTYVRQVIQTSKPVISNFVDEDFSKVKSIIDLNIKSIICVPVISHNRTIGALYIDSSEIENFREEDVDFLSLVGWIIGPHIDMIHLKMELQMNRMMLVGMITAMNLHDSNNLIQNLKFSAQIANMTKSPQDMEKLIEVVLNSANSLSGMNHNLLSFIKGTNITQEKINLKNMIKEVIDLVDKVMKKKYIKIETYVEEDIPTIYCNSILLKQVILNLIMNAKDAIQKDGFINISVIKSDSNIEIHVKDNGKGMTKEEIAYIFKPFYSTKEYKEGTSGMGLGLWTSQRIIDNFLQGQIDVISEVGKGTEFIVKIPIK